MAHLVIAARIGHMDTNQLRELLAAVQGGNCKVDDAVEQLRKLPFESVGYATIDHHRAIRCGHSEVIFCPGKSVQQVLGIASKLMATGQQVLATRASEQQLEAIGRQFENATINRIARSALFNEKSPVPEPAQDGSPFVAVISAGTADMPVAEEAAFTLRFMRVPTIRIMDVGVAGLHRLLSHVETIQKEIGRAHV